MRFQQILDKYRKSSFSERDKGNRFERLMQAYLQTDPQYAYQFKNVWLWNEFPGIKALVGTVTRENIIKASGNGKMTDIDYRVEKMRFPSKDNKSTIIYNSQVTIENIPAKAYEYIVNGKSAIEWIMERYQVTVHKDSGIKNDPNDWAREVGNPRYILDLLLSIINISI